MRHAVIAHFARQQDADWKAINAYARWASDTNWMLETIGGSVPQRGEDYKPEKSGDSKEGTLEMADADMKDRTEESPKSVLEEGRKPTRKRSKRRKILLSEEGKKSETAQSRSSSPRQPSRQRTLSIIPSNISELTKEKDITPLKKRGKDLKRSRRRSIGQIVNDTEEARDRQMSPQRYLKRERV
ncbi:uncharacterized protein MONOS_14391 [Monocercomonoides exilis]|uniref:uncharacterized protein n=1 Tax=Monocercomonoides exilis TaxID=2049356 RepID=UPI00355A7730|nr:hypothetical protein MONOS_14391 [Monocercomonoides exilis]|eukprot:MONOS_14391.1-p1 / transcript=MONOS_14391.1 / gene=MONOS_14391 / organism=Monocercomonoides_exilis_PA203 / gene_product=unspecified product / transcript_product=unspecified product / location=Mono_scaffold00994:13546-14145(-) / protein_length=185 / sequence_SO=supercontig / SO=protein_coding / is_pseudo=false